MGSTTQSASTVSPNEVVLVTGVNGFIGSHVADQALKHGYRVRGTVRGIDKHQWMIDFFGDKYGKGSFELVEVPDITAEGAFDEAVKDVSGVVHVASVVNFDTDAEKVIKIVVDSTLGILQAAAKAKTVKRFVLTSSLTAASFPTPGYKGVIDEKSWNEECIKLAFDPPEDLSETAKGGIVYGASKVKGEQAMWKWVEENKPDMVVNSVLPGGSFGTVLNREKQGFPSTTMFAAALFNDEKELIDMFIQDYPPEWFVDVQDAARVHIAALANPSVSNERLFACKSPFNWNVVLDELRGLFPEKKFREDEPGLWHDETQIASAARAEALLKEMGRTGYTSLGESLKNLMQS